jgi:hypothetical protein
MRPDDVLLWVRATPFVPFVLRLNSGRRFEIRHPEMLKVGRSTMHVYSYTDAPMDPYERVEMVSLVLIESIEPLDIAQPQ